MNRLLQSFEFIGLGLVDSRRLTKWHDVSYLLSL